MGDFRRVVDPFAGAGDLLAPFPNTVGYDVDPALGWIVNDSLAAIPEGQPGDICMTNPPYLALASAVKRGLAKADRFAGFSNLYLLALDRCLASFDRVVAIVPESFLHSGMFRDRLAFVNIIERQMFADTDQPVIVAGWAKNPSPDFMVYKNGKPVGSWAALNAAAPDETLDVRFNDPTGALGIVCSDTTKGKTIRFCNGAGIAVNAARRSYTRVAGIPVTPALIVECNRILDRIRSTTKDTILAPVWGNTIAGERRRRLTFTMARKIIAQAVRNLAVPFEMAA